MKKLVFAPIVCVLALGTACQRRAQLDEELVELWLDRHDQAAPLCGSAPAASARSLPLNTLMPLLSKFMAIRAQRVDHPALFTSSTGSCGGLVDVESNHKNGNTDFVLAFLDLCVGSSTESLAINGIFEATQVGRPSDLGPEIRAFEVETRGDVEVDKDGELIDVFVKNARTEYGTPAANAPATPTEADPDVTTIDEIRFKYHAHDKRVDYLRDLRFERSGDSVATIRVIHGELGARGEPPVDVSTPVDDPLVVDMSTLTATGGTLLIEGSRDSVVALSPRPGQPGVFDIELNGAPVDRTWDCTQSATAGLEIGSALLAALPIF